MEISPARPTACARDLQELIIETAKSNPIWGEERIANELLLKIGIRVSPRTVRRYMPKGPTRPADPKQRWMTFVRNQAYATLPATFSLWSLQRLLVHIFVILEIRTRRILHINVTLHPTAEWTLQQFRECVTGDEGYKYLIHDRDRIYSADLDEAVKALGLRVLRTPYQSPDDMIPLNAKHIRQTLKGWMTHYNRGRPHSSLGPGIPEPVGPKIQPQAQRHRIPNDQRVVRTSILG